MTSPRADGADRTQGATRRSGAGAAVGSLAVLLLVGLLLRLTIAYVLLPGSGFESDIGTFAAWASQLGERGPGDFYATAGFADYPPGYLYVLWLLGGLGRLLGPLVEGGAGSVIATLIKVPPMLADLGVAAALYYVVRSWLPGRRDAQRLALAAAAVYLFNPVTWYDSAIWGQTDAIGALLILLTVAALVRGNSEGAAVLAVVSALVKPQFGVVVLPVVAIVLLRRHLLRPGSNPRHPLLLPAGLRSWFETEDGYWRLISSGVCALLVLLALLAPFSLDVPGFINQMAKTAGGYPFISVNAYNPWALVGSDGAPPIALGGAWSWSPDTVPLLGPLPGVLIGGALLAAGFAVGIARLAWSDDRHTIVLVTLFLALAFFMLPTRVHERYMFPIFGLLPILAVLDRRWLWATLALSVAAFINLHGVLTQELYATPNLEHLPFGDLFRQPLGVISAIALHTASFAFIAWQMRPSASAAGARQAAQPPRQAAQPPRQAPAWTSVGPPDSLRPSPPSRAVEPRAPSPLREWLAGIASWPSVRRDRSAQLVHEPAGRLDRRDVLLLVLVFASALLLRTYRLEVPYGPHFDEVYHARTAVEFLQDWRYGMPHSIYEFTHPHLAKYLMALGIVTMGNNRAVDTRDLGVTVKAGALEPRWSSTADPNERNGDRLYVVTSEDVRAFDLATRGEIARLPVLAEAIAVDDDAHTLFTAAADGTVWHISTLTLDGLRTAGAGTPATVSPQRFAQLEGLNGPVGRLVFSAGRLIAISTGGTLVSLDTLSGAETGRTEIVDAAGVVGVSSRSEVVVDRTTVTDLPGVATTLAGILGDDAARIQAAVEGASGTMAIVAGDIGDLADDVTAAIDEGRLPGVSLVDAQMLAVGTGAGVRLLDAATLTDIRTIATTEPVRGMAFVTQGVESPTIYAASGPALATIRLGSDSPVGLGASVPMPNAIEDVVWNPATTNVHALGRTPDGSAPTVYVVEPRSNSVFADARLGFEPRALLMDAQKERPAEDRDDLLALSPSGQLATVDVGNNQFAYRFPGVLLGALMAACIYLLARFLFRRRAVAVIAAVLVLADGMFFANARIAMNDSYVAFFIVAAFTLFVPLWLGRWRSRWALALGLLGVGVLLGLALASKWVGLYAIGAVGLLILLRSALGRWLALMSMIAMTAVLGYIAVTPSATQENPQLNYMFLIVMAGLTAMLAVGMTLRPMRMSDDEKRLAALALLVPGPLLFVYGLLRVLAGGPPPILGTLLTPQRITILGAALTVIGVLVVLGLWLVARRGYGPLSAYLGGNASEPKAPPPARGWLRPGSGPLGLPWLAALTAILVVPIAVYVISYTPWIDLGNRWLGGEVFFGIRMHDLPGDHTGQTLLNLQEQMYNYHNNLRATHPASSPWWAWPLDLKPVWFEQADYAGSTTAVIYDTGNLVIFWLAIPAVGWLAWQAWQRRSLALGFLCIAIASLWLPWARIDRATFQYHIFTTLPFSFIGLAYFLAELWHGPSPRTWLLARAGAALAIIGAPLLWLLRLPLCGIAQTEKVNSGTEVCGALARQLVLTDFQLVGLLLALAGLIGAGVLVYLGLRNGEASGQLSLGRSLLLPVSFSVALLGVTILTIGAGLPGNPVLQTQVRAEEPALVALLLLAVPAYFVLRATDPRRFVISALGAAAIWFVAFYPNIASLPVPTPLSQIHLGLLPTWNWGFQFAVNLDEPAGGGISWPGVGLLAAATVGMCIAAAYAARNWHSARLGADEVSALPETS